MSRGNFADSDHKIDRELVICGSRDFSAILRADDNLRFDDVQSSCYKDCRITGRRLNREVGERLVRMLTPRQRVKKKYNLRNAISTG